MEIDQQIFNQSCYNEEHRKRLKRVIILGRQIMYSLGPDSLLFLEYESSVGMLNNFYIRSAYEAGLEDGKRLAQLNNPAQQNA